MIKTTILLEMDGNWPVWHKLTGLAKTLPIAWWMFLHSGWKQEGQEFPDMGYVEETVEWPEGDQYFPCNRTELWVLGSRLHLN